MYRRILVTGGGSSIGGALRAIAGEYPALEFICVRSSDADLTQQDAAHALVARVRPDAIFHCAAGCGGIQHSLQYPATLLRDNVLMNFHLLEAARACQVKKTIMTLTTGMYPVAAPIPIAETAIHDGPPHPSNYGSSFAKRLVEPMLRAYREEYGMNVIGLVPNGILGEQSSFHPDDAIMPAALIRRFYEHRNDDAPIVLWGDGSPLREITYAKDIARAYCWCLQHYHEAEILNIGTTEEASVKTIASIIAKRIGVDLRRIQWDTSKPAGIFRKSTDNARFARCSNFQYTPLRTTLERTIDYFCAHYPDGLRL